MTRHDWTCVASPEVDARAPFGIALGLPQDFAPERARSLGMQLVISLAGQLDGSLAWGPDGDAGTAFRLRFTPVEPEAQRLRMN